MAAPTAVLTHGSAIDLVDEPSVSSVIQVESFTFTGNRDERQSKNYDGSVFRIQKRNPHAKIALKGYQNGSGLGSGISIQEAGTEIASLSNFAATRHGCDNAVGAILLDSISDELTVEDDVSLNMEMTWWPYL
jgi:hypothetical protein